MKGLIIIGSAQIGSHTNALSKYLKGQQVNTMLRWKSLT